MTGKSGTKRSKHKQQSAVKISPRITGTTRTLLEKLIEQREKHLEKHPDHAEKVGEILKGMFPIAKSDDLNKDTLLEEKLKKLKALGGKKGGCGCGSGGKTGGCGCGCDGGKMGGDCGCTTGGKRKSKRSAKRSAKRSPRRK